MSYSILQTLLHFSYKKLNKYQLITIYEFMNKYIKYDFKQKMQKSHLEEYQKNIVNLNTIIKENVNNLQLNFLIFLKKLLTRGGG